MRLRNCLAAFLLLAIAGRAQGPVAPKAGRIYFAEGVVLLNVELLAADASKVLFVQEGAAIGTAPVAPN